MAAFVNRCQFVATSAGTGTFTVAKAAVGYMTPAQAGAISTTTYGYAAQTLDSKGAINAWEIGHGIYTATTTFTRSPLFSSNANHLVNFSTAPTVFLTPLAADFGSSNVTSFADLTGNIAITQMNNGTGASAANFWRGDGVWAVPPGGGGGGGVGFTPPLSTTQAGTAGTFQVDQSNGNLWLCVTNNQWQVFKGAFDLYGGVGPGAVVVDVTDAPFSSLVTVGGDWAAALNAASAYILANGTIGTIILPPFNINFANTWTIGDPINNVAITIHIRGQGVSQLTYTGPLDRPAIRVCKNKRGTYSNFSLIQGVGGNPGSSVGLVLGGNAGSGGGTECTGGVLHQVNIFGFQTQVADLIGAASEIVFINCFLGGPGPASSGFNTRGTGFDLFNSTNITFIETQLTNLDIGIDATNGTVYSVFGASTSLNAVDFRAGARCHLLLDSCRTDGLSATGRLILGASGNVTARNLRVPAGNGTDNITISGSFKQFILRDSIINGYISIDAGPCNLIDVTGNELWPIANTKLPIKIINAAASCPVHFRANNYTNQDIADGAPVSSRVPCVEFDGEIFSDDFGDITFNPMNWIQPAGGNDSKFAGYVDPYGVMYQELFRVRCLSEAGISVDASGGTSTIFPGGKNLRVQGTFATSATLAIAFTRSVTVSAPGGTQISLTSGTFFQSDVGKQCFISGGGNPSGDFNGMINSLASTTNAVVLTQQGAHAPVFAGTKTAVIGTNEPDAHYMVLVTGNVGETFWVDTIASTGFTVHSSNASSTATVTCLIVR